MIAKKQVLKLLNDDCKVLFFIFLHAAKTVFFRTFQFFFNFNLHGHSFDN